MPDLWDNFALVDQLCCFYVIIYMPQEAVEFLKSVDGRKHI